MLMRKGKRTFASRKRKIAGLCAFVLAGLMGLGAYAFTASNTVPAQAAGGGAAAVSGYTETGASYTWSVTTNTSQRTEFILRSRRQNRAERRRGRAEHSSPTGNGRMGRLPCGQHLRHHGGKKVVVKCKFKGSNGAHVSLTTFGEDYKWATNGVPNAERVTS